MPRRQTNVFRGAAGPSGGLPGVRHVGAAIPHVAAGGRAEDCRARRSFPHQHTDALPRPHDPQISQGVLGSLKPMGGETIQTGGDKSPPF